MILKTCLQFDEAEPTGTDHLKFCLNLVETDTLIYAEDNFLSSSCEDHFPVFEFPSNINLVKEINCKSDKFLVVVLEDSTMIIIDLKTKKILKEFNNILPSRIIQIRQNSTNFSIYLLTEFSAESSSIFLIDNFILFTRLTPDLLKERYESGQILKEFTLESKVNDFYITRDSADSLEFLTVGSDQMISWWKVSDQTITAPNSTKSSLINYFSSAFVAVKPPEDPKKPPKFPLKQVKFLNEPDRVIDKILLVQGNLALLEDSTHGRLLVLDTEHALILKTFKGYRNCSARRNSENRLLIWAGNRFTLETWDNFPFCETKTSAEEFPHCQGRIEGNNFYLYDPENYQLKHILFE